MGFFGVITFKFNYFGLHVFDMYISRLPAQNVPMQNTCARKKKKCLANTVATQETNDFHL